LEDLLHRRGENLTWSKIRETTPLNNLSLVSTSPFRQSQNLFYLHKNEIIYHFNNSTAKIKLTDFGGGINKDILDMLSNIRIKILVINKEATSQEAIFYLMLAIISEQIKKLFAMEYGIKPLLQKFRNCIKTGFSMTDFLGELENLDHKKKEKTSPQQFYHNEIEPFKREIGLPWVPKKIIFSEDFDIELDIITNQLHKIFFQSNGDTFNLKFNRIKKSSLYKRLRLIQEETQKFHSCKQRLTTLLKKSQYGLIINKANGQEAWEIQQKVAKHINQYLGISLVYLGNLREREALKNISDYGMPFVLVDPDEEGMINLYDIGENLLGLKEGSLRYIIKKQYDFIKQLRTKWKSSRAVFSTPQNL